MGDIGEKRILDDFDTSEEKRLKVTDDFPTTQEDILNSQPDTDLGLDLPTTHIETQPDDISTTVGAGTSTGAETHVVGDSHMTGDQTGMKKPCQKMWKWLSFHYIFHICEVAKLLSLMGIKLPSTTPLMLRAFKKRIPLPPTHRTRLARSQPTTSPLNIMR